MGGYHVIARSSELPVVARRVLDVYDDNGRLACVRCLLLSLLSERRCLLFWNSRVCNVLRMLCVLTVCLFVCLLLLLSSSVALR